MSLTAEDCDDCVPDYLRRGFMPSQPAALLPTLPFALTFLCVALLAHQKLYPRLSGQDAPHEAPESASRKPPASSRPVFNTRSCGTITFDRVANLVFSVTLALSAILAMLIFCEITNTLSRDGRGTAMTLTITSLLPLLILVTPALEIYSVFQDARSKLSSSGRSTSRFSWFFGLFAYAAWLFAFWWIGEALVGPSTKGNSIHTFREGCLERIAIIGIASMAILAGFAAISSLWQAFGVKARKVTETDIARKEAGVAATSDLLSTKESRLRALERKMSEAPNESIMTRIVGSIRGNPDSNELSAVRLEISGLEDMRASLASSLRLLRTRRQAQQTSSTAFGRLCLSASYIFSLYCLYRIIATSLALLRRWWAPATTFASTDPINKVLALVAKHIDPSIDKDAWSSQISFLLSGVMLLASFNAVLQTVLLLGRFMPSRFLHSFHQNLALFVSQISAIYVVSSALLLRSNLPKQLGGMIEEAFGTSVLDTGFMERWFEGWFLGACLFTATGIWAGRKIVGTADWEDDLANDDLGNLEGGKRS